MSNVTLVIPPATTYEVPEGTFYGKLHSAVLKDEGTEKEGVRFMFRLHVPTITDKVPLIGKNFHRNSTSLREFLERWLGAEFVSGIAGKAFDFNNLVGTEADVTVVHIRNPGFDKPFRNITSVTPLRVAKLSGEQKDGGAQ